MRSFACSFAFEQKTLAAGCLQQDLAAVNFADHVLHKTEVRSALGACVLAVSTDSGMVC